jgi:hypothetical protein
MIFSTFSSALGASAIGASSLGASVVCVFLYLQTALRAFCNNSSSTCCLDFCSTSSKTLTFNSAILDLI